MSQQLELPDDVFTALQQAARAGGTTPAGWIAQCLARSQEATAATVATGGLRGVPAEQVRGMAAGQNLPPDDDTVKQWIHQQRLEKYG